MSDTILDLIGTNLVYLDGLTPFDIKINHLINCSDTDENRYHNHYHERCEIYFNISGNVSFVVEDSVYPIKKGSIILTRPHEAHHCVYHDNSPHEHFCIAFSSNGNERLLPMFFERHSGRDNHIILNEEDTDVFKVICKSIIELKDESPLKSIMVFMKLLDVLNSGRAQTDKKQGGSYLIQEALYYIRKHITEEISIATLASIVHTSISTFERAFKKEIGMSPSKYILERKLSMAAVYLSNGESVAATAEKCGFSDYSHFISHFKKRFGKTPLQYKKSRK